MRGEQSANNFINNGDGTVTDTNTGLMWEVKADDGGQRDKDDTYTWEEALSYCENLSFAGYDDWRLPNINELQSIVDYGRYVPSIDTTYFPYVQSDSYWSSTSLPSVGSANNYVAFHVYFFRGDAKTIWKLADVPYVRAVRGGQGGSFDTSTTTTVLSDTTTSTTSIDGSTTTSIDESSTTTTINGGLCSSELIYGESSEQTELLRYIRDNVLHQTPAGQEIIRLYYEWSPTIVKAIEKDEEFKKAIKELIDWVLELIVEEE